MTYKDNHLILLKTVQVQTYNDIQVDKKKIPIIFFGNNFLSDSNIKLLNKICTILPIKDDF